MVRSAFHASKVEHLSTRNSWELVVKLVVTPLSGTAAWNLLNVIHKKVQLSFFKK